MEMEKRFAKYFQQFLPQALQKAGVPKTHHSQPVSPDYLYSGGT